MEPKDRLTEYTSEKFINIVAFAMFCFVPYALFFIALFAAQEILAGTEIPTAVVFVCDIAPYCLGTLVLPFFVVKMSHLSPMLFTFGFDLLGITFLAIVNNINVKLIAVCMISLGNAFADVGLLSLTALYGEVTVNAYSAGGGIGALAAIIYYAGMTTWFCVSMDTTLMSIMWLPLLLPIFYCLMDKKPSNEVSVTKPTSYEDVPYSPLNSKLQEERGDKELQLTRRDKLTIVLKNMPLFLSFYVGTFGKFFLMGSVVTSLAFSNVPFEPRDHYQYYMFAVIFGVVIGTSYGLVMYCFKCNLTSHTRHTWIFSSVITAGVLFLVFESWFRFLHSVWFVIFVAFLVGLNEGVLYYCTFASAACNTRSAIHKRFCRAFLTGGMGLGLTCASLLGLYIEPLLREHCFQISEYPTNCLTRVIDMETNKCLFN